MKPHLRYLRYVLLHKLYVFRAGVAINGWSLPWLWRLLVHDLSKFSRAEWGPYVAYFYGDWRTRPDAHERDKVMMAAFDRAWLHHQHHNPHHWQHWLLREDSGANKVLLPAAPVVDEMVADWLGAGQKILRRPTMEECVRETIVWYVKQRNVIILREQARQRVEYVLMGLADDYGLVAQMLALRAEQQARASITIAPPQQGGLARIEQL